MHPKSLKLISCTLLIFVLQIGLLSCKEIRNDKIKTEIPSVENISSEANLFSILVAKNDEIVFEEYYNNKTKDSLCNVQSLTKGLMSILIGIAIDHNYIESVDVPINQYFPETFEAITDKRKQSITLKHLLNQTSGLSWQGYLEHEGWLNSKDPIYYVLEKSLDAIPGETYNYNSGATHLLSVVLSKSTGMTTLEFANKFLFQPLEITNVDWQKRNSGYYDGSGLGLRMKPIDLLKIGQLLEQNGSWHESIIVSKSWIDKMFDGNEKSETQWGLEHSKHGFCWYQAPYKTNIINYGMGYGGQFIILVPHQNLVIVATHNHDTPNGIEQQMKFLYRKLPQLIEKHSS